jgi:hypothetical protein
MEVALASAHGLPGLPTLQVPGPTCVPTNVIVSRSTASGRARAVVKKLQSRRPPGRPASTAPRTPCGARWRQPPRHGGSSGPCVTSRTQDAAPVCPHPAGKADAARKPMARVAVGEGVLPPRAPPGVPGRQGHRAPDPPSTGNRNSHTKRAGHGGEVSRGRWARHRRRPGGGRWRAGRRSWLAWACRRSRPGRPARSKVERANGRQEQLQQGEVTRLSPRRQPDGDGGREQHRGGGPPGVPGARPPTWRREHEVAEPGLGHDPLDPGREHLDGRPRPGRRERRRPRAASGPEGGPAARWSRAGGTGLRRTTPIASPSHHTLQSRGAAAPGLQPPQAEGERAHARGDDGRHGGTEHLEEEDVPETVKLGTEIEPPQETPGEQAGGGCCRRRSRARSRSARSPWHWRRALRRTGRARGAATRREKQGQRDPRRRPDQRDLRHGGRETPVHRRAAAK